MDTIKISLDEIRSASPRPNRCWVDVDASKNDEIDARDEPIHQIVLAHGGYEHLYLTKGDAVDAAQKMVDALRKTGMVEVEWNP